MSNRRVEGVSIGHASKQYETFCALGASPSSAVDPPQTHAVQRGDTVPLCLYPEDTIVAPRAPS